MRFDGPLALAVLVLVLVEMHAEIEATFVFDLALLALELSLVPRRDFPVLRVGALHGGAGEIYRPRQLWR